jgi:hypothetical protein
LLPRPLQYLQVPVLIGEPHTSYRPTRSGAMARPHIPRAAVIPGPLQDGQVPAPAAQVNKSSSPTGSPAPAPTATFPRSRVERRSAHVLRSHGHTLSLAHANLWTDPRKSTSFSGTAPPFPAWQVVGQHRRQPRRPHPREQGASVGSSRSSTCFTALRAGARGASNSLGTAASSFSSESPSAARRPAASARAPAAARAHTAALRGSRFYAHPLPI